MTLQERMARAFPMPQKRGLQAQIARACEVKPPTVSAWFNKPEKVAALDLQHAEVICEQFQLDISPRWLAYGVGDMAGPNERLPAKLNAGVALEEALRALSKAFSAADDLSRLQVGALLETWVQHPGRNEEIERRIIGLLRAPPAARAKSFTTKEEI